MPLNAPQKGVLAGMGIGAFAAIAILVAGTVFNPLSYAPQLDLGSRVAVAAQACLVLAIVLGVSIARLARHRFLTPEDIDGSSAGEGTRQARILQSLVQNTLEQSLLAAMAYLAWAVLMPAHNLSVVPLAAIAFALGRVLFFAGYGKGARSRATGFALTFYPTLAMLLCVVAFTLWQ